MSLPFDLINEALGVKIDNFYLVPPSSFIEATPRRTTRTIPWYSPEIIRNGGFFIAVTKEQYDKNQGRLTTPPPAKSAKHGVRYWSKKGQLPDGRNVKYGHFYFCEPI